MAIVGAGPAACYAAKALIAIEGVEVDVFERLPTPYGLIRAGVAPDHQHTKSVVDLFGQVFASPRFGTHFNVEIGRDLTHDDLLAHHHAVIYAVGACDSRDLDLPGEQLPGSYAASDFVAWYNGHPDHSANQFDLSARRAVIIGNGNVALDVARVLLMDAEKLHTTDVAQHALESLRDNRIEEVVILGRRGARHAAFSAGEFLALGHLHGVDVVIEGIDAADDVDATPGDDVETALKLDLAREYAAQPTTLGHKRIVFRFLSAPVELVGDDRVEGVVVVRNKTGGDGGLVLGDPDTDTEVIDTTLVLRSIGYRGSAIKGLPFDAAAGVIPNDRGRVVNQSRDPVAGVYVTGWIKRGPRGVIGTNRICAEETVAAVLADFDHGLLARSVESRESLLSMIGERGIDVVTWAGWRAIDAAERTLGAAASRPRVKLVEIATMLTAAGVTA